MSAIIIIWPTNLTRSSVYSTTKFRETALFLFLIKRTDNVIPHRCMLLCAIGVILTKPIPVNINHILNHITVYNYNSSDSGGCANLRPELVI